MGCLSLHSPAPAARTLTTAVRFLTAAPSRLPLRRLSRLPTPRVLPQPCDDSDADPRVPPARPRGPSARNDALPAADANADGCAAAPTTMCPNNMRSSRARKETDRRAALGWGGFSRDKNVVDQSEASRHAVFRHAGKKPTAFSNGCRATLPHTERACRQWRASLPARFSPSSSSQHVPRRRRTWTSMISSPA